MTADVCTKDGEHHSGRAVPVESRGLPGLEPVTSTASLAEP